MGWVDLVVIAVLAVTSMVGFRRGLLRGVVELVGLTFGVFLALYLTGGFVETYTGPASQWRITPPLVFIGIVGIAMLIAQVAGRVASEIIQVTFFGWFDQFGGAMAGVAKGAMWLSIIITFVLHLNLGPNVTAQVEESTLGPPLAKLLPAAFDVVESYAADVRLRDPFDAATQ